MGKADSGKARYIGLADNIFRLYKHNFGLYFKITIIFFLIPIFAEKIAEMRLELPSGISGAIGLALTAPFRSVEWEPDVYDDNYPQMLCCFMASVFIINFILNILYAGPVILASSRMAFDKEISLRETFRISGRTYYYLIMATIGYTGTLILIYYASSLLIMVPAMAVPLIGIPCGCSFFIIPLAFLVYVGVIYSLYMPAIILEGCKSRESVGRSAKLVRGLWWMTFRVLMGVLVIQTVLLLSSEFSFRALGQYLVSINTDLEIFSEAFSATGLTLVHMFVRPILFIALTLLFYEVKAKKEGYDIEMMIENF